MYHEFRSTSREDIKYPYTGKELLESARKLRDQYRAAEMAARNEMAELLRDPSVSQTDERLANCKKAIEKNGAQYEACTVFATGFKREPERSFNLSLGDVVYFGLNLGES